MKGIFEKSWEEKLVFSITKYELFKSKLDKLEETKCKGAAIRSRVKSYLEGERCTAYFLRLEKRNQQKTQIDHLVTNEGKIVTNSDETSIEKYWRLGVRSCRQLHRCASTRNKY